MFKIVGETVWGLLAVIILMIGQLALKFFTTASDKIKLLVYLLLVGIYLLTFTVISNIFKENELIDSPVPTSVMQSDKKPFSFVTKALADSKDQWIYCGDYDFSARQWKVKFLDIGNRSPTKLRRQVVSVLRKVNVYDTPPIFSRIKLKWTLGKIRSSLEDGQQVKVMECRTFGRGRIWCRITKE